jgi:hypothetical protein
MPAGFPHGEKRLFATTRIGEVASIGLEDLESPVFFLSGEESTKGVDRFFSYESPRCFAKGRRSLHTSSYFKVNIAFTCAVTVTFWGENSAVGAGVGAMAAMARIIGRGAIILTFSCVSTEA